MKPGLFFIWSIWLATVSWAFGMREGMTLAAPYLDLSDVPFWFHVGFITIAAAACMLALAWPMKQEGEP